MDMMIMKERKRCAMMEMVTVKMEMVTTVKGRKRCAMMEMVMIREELNKMRCTSRNIALDSSQLGEPEKTLRWEKMKTAVRNGEISLLSGINPKMHYLVSASSNTKTRIMRQWRWAEIAPAKCNRSVKIDHPILPKHLRTLSWQPKRRMDNQRVTPMMTPFLMTIFLTSRGRVIHFSHKKAPPTFEFPNKLIQRLSFQGPRN